MNINKLEFLDLFVLDNKDKSSKRLDKPMPDISLFTTEMQRTLSQTVIWTVFATLFICFEFLLNSVLFWRDEHNILAYLHYCSSLLTSWITCTFSSCVFGLASDPFVLVLFSVSENVQVFWTSTFVQLLLRDKSICTLKSKSLKNSNYYKIVWFCCKIMIKIEQKYFLNDRFCIFADCRCISLSRKKRLKLRNFYCLLIT